MGWSLQKDLPSETSCRRYPLSWRSKSKMEKTLPKDWKMVRLGEATLELKSGFPCGKSDLNKDSNSIPHLRPMNVSVDGQFVWEGTKYISQEIFKNNTGHVLKKGDILFNNTN